MSHRMRVFVVLVLAIPLLAPVTVAQKPPAPAPAPPPPASAPSTHPANSPPLGSDLSQPAGDLVMYIRGRVATDDGTPVPFDVSVQRVCNNTVSQQLYASPQGDFSMQLGSRADSYLDASGDSTSLSGVPGKDSDAGISRRELRNCELRASTSGFRDGIVSLMDLDPFGTNIDVGVIVVHRGTKIDGMTLSATPYKAPKDARRAYEKGLDAERKGKLANARRYFETAVQMYPKFTNAWFQLGAVSERENRKDAARTAYTQATSLDTKFLPPYLALASMAYEAENWTDVLAFTGHILDLDPLNHAVVTGYIVDLDPLNCAEAYFYNAVANYKLNKIEDAEKSALKAEHYVDLRTRFPQLYLLLAEIFARKNDYPTAISELQTYLEIAPHAKNADQVREQLAKLEKLNDSVSTGEKPDRR
jgi:tetratricopeptide (TPR) repeat protein